MSSFVSSLKGKELTVGQVTPCSSLFRNRAQTCPSKLRVVFRENRAELDVRWWHSLRFLLCTKMMVKNAQLLSGYDCTTASMKGGMTQSPTKSK